MPSVHPEPRHTLGTDVLELEIEKIVPGGLGLARHAGQVAFVPNTAPGDRIRGHVTAIHRHHLTVQCIEILSSGPDTVDPGCAVFGQCGGCHMRRLSASLQDRIKTDFVREGLSRIAHLDVTDSLRPLIPALERDGYRRRVSFKVQWRDLRVLLGFYAAASNTLVDIEECPILDPRLAALMPPLRQLIAALSIREQIISVDMVVGDIGMGMIFSLTRSCPATDKLSIRRFADAYHLQQVWLREGRNRVDIVLVMHGPLAYTADGFEFYFHPGDFIQGHATQNRRMIEEVLWLGGEGKSAWDLFCGVGNFTLPLSRRFKLVKGVEGHARAVQLAKKNLQRNQVTNVSIQREDLFRETKITRLQGMDQVDLVLLDPPRSGADPLCRLLAHHGPERMIYLSCDPATFARDAALLVLGGYGLESVQPLDLFPQTKHVEVVALFRRT
ncbi:MAG: 23S rRNA (uracil(1939)-C(5))-methyltransferase RlmD [Magnetococcus sp. YQC-5]